MNDRIANLVAALSGKKKKPESESMPESTPESKPVETKPAESLPEKPRKSLEQQLLEKEHIDMDYPTYEDEEGKPYKPIDDDFSENEKPKRRGLFGDGGKGLSIIIAMGKGRRG
jgi:hypothetical protein